MKLPELELRDVAGDVAQSTLIAFKPPRSLSCIYEGEPHLVLEG
jgi:hypothetical protein